MNRRVSFFLDKRQNSYLLIYFEPRTYFSKSESRVQLCLNTTFLFYGFVILSSEVKKSWRGGIPVQHLYVTSKYIGEYNV